MGSSIDPELQLYRSWGQWGWLRGGLDYSPWINQATIPDTLEYEGPNAIPEPINPQILLKVPVGKALPKLSDWKITLAAEDADWEVTLPTGVSNVDTVNQIPSLVAKLGFEPTWAQIELAGLYRRVRVAGDRFESSLNGWGILLDGYIQTLGKDNLILGIEYGEGLGSYIDDTQDLGLDAAPVSASDPSLKAIPAFGIWAGYQHWWNRTLRSTATYGYVGLDNGFDRTANPEGKFQKSQYASANLIWTPIPAVDVGLEYLFGWREVTANSAINGHRTGDDHRIQWTVRWKFKRER
jgi:hypothetical protein